MGAVLTVHIWWEFNVVNSKYSGIWVMSYGALSQPAMINDVASCHEAILTLLNPFLNTQIAKTSRKTDCCANSQVGTHLKLFFCNVNNDNLSEVEWKCFCV